MGVVGLVEGKAITGFTMVVNHGSLGLRAVPICSNVPLYHLVNKHDYGKSSCYKWENYGQLTINDNFPLHPLPCLITRGY